MTLTKKHTFGNSSGIYDVYKIITYSKKFKAERIELAKVSHNLNQYCWGGKDASEEKVKPINLLINSNQLNSLEYYHYSKSMRSDLRFPIILNRDYEVIDGMHRLVKAVLRNKSSILAIVLDELPESAKIKNRPA